jgi:hypothetical protein
MKACILAGVGVICFSFVSPQTVSQNSQEQAIQQLGPEPFWITPRSLTDLVNTAQAAVIVEIVEPGDLKIEQASTPGGKALGPRAYAVYRVVISEVLYNRISGDAPALVPGASVELTKHVGRQEAEAFVARQLPVAAHDNCLLFLWHRPGAAEWSVLQWPLQFRKSRRVQGAAEALGSPAELQWLDAKWLGPRVPMSTDAGAVLPMWPQLLSEVKHLAGEPMRR